MDTPQQRLRHYINLNYKTQAEFCRKIGMRVDALNKYLGDNSSLMGKKYEQKLIDIGLNYDWYKTGQGEMLLRKDIVPVRNGFNGVPFYPIDVTASIVRSFNDIEEAPEYYIDYKPFNDCDAYFPVFGDSMYPMFNSGDVIAVRKVRNPNIILWGEPHFIITDEYANNMKTIKLLYHCESDNNSVILRASNPNFKGDTIIPKSSILDIFIVKGKINQRIL